MQNNNRSDDENSINRLLTDSRQSLADVQLVIERGRVPTGMASAIRTLGPWSIGTVYCSDDLQIYLYVSSSEEPPVEIEVAKQRSVYLVKRGKVLIRTALTEYQLSDCNTYTIGPDIKHSLEPMGMGAQLLAVLVG